MPVIEDYLKMNLHEVVVLHAIIGDDLHLGTALKNTSVGMYQSRAVATARKGDCQEAASIQYAHCSIEGHVNAGREEIKEKQIYISSINDPGNNSPDTFTQ